MLGDTHCMYIYIHYRLKMVHIVGVAAWWALAHRFFFLVSKCNIDGWFAIWTSSHLLQAAWTPSICSLTQWEEIEVDWFWDSLPPFYNVFCLLKHPHFTGVTCLIPRIAIVQLIPVEGACVQPVWNEPSLIIWFSGYHPSCVGTHSHVLGNPVEEA